ncbi:c-type cytochrome [Polymorphobacter sp.]|uniref:c-type cytochrome n=1 Tax=Polymorphobacter sp. TaxID=1909290 RepID=UPI003F6F1804
MTRVGGFLLGGVALLALGGAAVATWYRTAPAAAELVGGDPVALAAYRGPDPTGVPAALRGASLVERGAYLVRAADCEPCHSAPGRPAFSGGRSFSLPFGNIHSSNITPDPSHGIGGWTDEQFVAAVRHGVRRDGTPLYPAMPYTSYAAMTEADALAIRAWLATLPPAALPVPVNTLGFPFNERRLMTAWNWLFAKDETFRPDQQRSPQWNRGAYLAEALGHCSECHTPRGPAFAVDNRRKYAGALTGGWMAHNLTSHAQSGIGGWSDAELATYLRTGFAVGRGGAGGPMGEAIDHGLRYLTGDDIAALVAYLRTLPPIDTVGPRRTRPAAEGFAKASGGSEGERVFAANCAGCHDWTGVSPLSPYATLTGLRGVNDPGAANIVQSVLNGVPRPAPDGMAPMPAFGSTLSDGEVAAVANFVSARFGSQGSQLDERQVAQLRVEGRH